MKVAVVVPVALLLGLGLGTAAGRMLNPPPAAAATGDSTGADHGDSSTVKAPAAEGAKPAEGEQPTEGHATDSAPPTMTPKPLDAATVPPTPASGQAAPSADVQRMAKIFNRLGAQDAAALVAQMSDTELEGILRAMDIAKAGDVIAALPKERGAAISKRMITPAAKP